MRKTGRICLYAALCLILFILSACGKHPTQNEPGLTGDIVSGSDTEIESSGSGLSLINPPSDPSIDLTPRSEFAMEHTLKMLNEEKRLKVDYIGGSVTAGTGVEAPNTYSWRALTNAWLRERYPDASISEVQAVIGGTGSLLGVHRYDYEVLAEEPDLIFIEFAINDYLEGRSYQACVNTVEAMIRKTLQTRPCADIVIVLTTDEDCGAGEFESLRAHRDVAEAYGIPCICVGQELAKHIQETGEPWNTYFTDYVHPNEAGYAFYADVVKTRLSGLLDGSEKLAYTTPSAPLGTDDYEDAGIVLPKQLMKYAETDGFSWQYRSFSWVGERYGGVASGGKQGATLTFAFTGTELGIFYDTAADAGIVSVEIDGKNYGTIDAYAENQFPVMKILADGLSEGTHTVTIQITGRNPRATGFRFDIGAILYR